jgi:hypothetical protein
MVPMSAAPRLGTPESMLLIYQSFFDTHTLTDARPHPFKAEAPPQPGSDSCLTDANVAAATSLFL